MGLLSFRPLLRYAEDGRFKDITTIVQYIGGFFGGTILHLQKGTNILKSGIFMFP